MMTRLVINYIATIVLAFTVSLGMLIAMAWFNQTEFNFTESLIHLIEVSRSSQLVAKEAFGPETDKPIHEFPLGTATWLSSDDIEELVAQENLNSDYTVVVYSVREGRALKLETDRSLLDAAIERNDNLFLYILGSSVFVFVLAGAFLAVPLVKKLQQQESVIRKLADGDLSARTSMSANDAVGQLGQRINVMANRLEHLVNGQKELLQTVSHELRTPVNRLHFLLELLDKDIETGSANALKRTAEIRRDLFLQDEMIDELLIYSRLDTVTELESSEVDLAKIADSAIRQSRFVSPDIEIRIRFETREMLVVADARLIHRLLSNLISNACKNAVSLVHVIISYHEMCSCISIVDDGPGLRESDRSKVFEPFVKLDNDAGFGLGLAICKRIVDAHKGRIEFVGESPGATCEVKLPIAGASPTRVEFSTMLDLDKAACTNDEQY